MSVGLLVAIFVSNLPEAIGSASEMRAAASRAARSSACGWSSPRLPLATVAGYAIADNVRRR